MSQDGLTDMIQLNAIIAVSKEIEQEQKTGRPPITNTAKRDPAITVMEALNASRRTGDPSAFIHDMEARGQQEVAAAMGTRLPSAGTVKYDSHEEEHPDKEILMALGFSFGAIMEDDPLWVEAKLPDGWSVQSTEHSMTSHVLDEKGRARASIFYKAAFYDRKASFYLKPRFEFESFCPVEDNYDLVGIHVKDAGRVIHSTEPCVSTADKRAYYLARKTAEAWLDEHRPGWQDPVTSWNLP